jgi:hypothetical protein
MTENQEGPGRKRRSGEEIKRLVLEFEASGLRQNEFCRNHRLALSTLQRQLKKRRLNKSEAQEGRRFVAVKLAGREPNGNSRSRGISLMTETVGLIVEVKSGGWNPNDLNDPTHEWQVRDGLKRMGMISPEQLENAVAELNREPVTRVGGFRSGKLFVGNGPTPENTTWLHMQLDDADQFVRRRMRTYRDRKFRHRLFFQGDLIQYLAWKGSSENLPERAR